MKMPSDEQMVIVLDFGSQYNQLIARRIRENKVYCEILPYNTSASEIASLSPKGIFLSGGPSSVYGLGAPKCDPEIFNLGIPVLGICYGMQLMSHILGGKVEPALTREYGLANLVSDEAASLFNGEEFPVWMSHGDNVSQAPEGFEVIAHTANLPIAAMADMRRGLYGLQFHPEVVHTPSGKDIIANFLFHVCGCSASWTM